MQGFVVGGKVVGDPYEDPKLKAELEQEKVLLQEVTEETLPPIELTSEQQAAIAEVKNAIVLSDDNLVLSYGVAESKGFMELSNKTLGHVRASDIGSVGGVLGELATQLSVSNADEESKGLFGLFKKTVDRAKALQIRYESASDNIDRVLGILENDQLTLMKNNRDLEDMKEANKETFRRLSVYVAAGKERIEDAYKNELPALEAKAAAGNQTEINELTEFRNSLNLFEKQVHDLDAQMSLSQAMAIQLETLSNTNRGLIQKIHRSKSILIPSWRMYMMMAFYTDQAEKARANDELVTNSTNALLVKVTEDLAKTAKTSAEQSERAAIDISTLESMTSNVILALKDVEAAHAKGREYRQNATIRIGELREQLKTQLISTVASEKEARHA